MDLVVSVEENVNPLDTSGRLSAVGGEKGPEGSSVFSWVRTAPLANKLHRKALDSGRTAMSHALETLQTTSDLIMADKLTTFNLLDPELFF